MSVAATKLPPGCVTCKRGALATALPPPYDRVDTSLKVVMCTDVIAHERDVDHNSRCSGRVYMHTDPLICRAVLRIAKRN